MASRNSKIELPGPKPAVWLLIALTGVILFLCWLMLAPFVSPITWALALSVVLNPIRNRLIRQLPKTVVAAMMPVLVVIVIGPAVFLVSQRLIYEVSKGQELFRGLLQPGIWKRLTESASWVGTVARWVQSQFDLSGIAQEISTAVARVVAPAFSRSAVGLSRLFLSVFFFFFFVRDQETFVEAIRRAIPLTSPESDLLFDRTTATVQATVIGRIGIGLIQGTIGGILFFLLGIPAPLFWSIVMAILSMLPVVGSYVVWIPAAIVLLFSGHWVRALILVAGGIGLIHPVDNIIYPLLLGPRLGMHPAVLLIAFLGGLVVFGPPGIVLGPVTVTVATVLWEIWTLRLKQA